MVWLPGLFNVGYEWFSSSMFTVQVLALHEIPSSDLCTVRAYEALEALYFDVASEVAVIAVVPAATRVILPSLSMVATSVEEEE